MIVLDSSAVVAIALGEPEAADFFHLMTRSTVLIGAPTLVEVRIVLVGRGVRDPLRAADIILANTATDVLAFDEAMALIAADAFLRFGRGRHPAALNYGDCMAYAVAKSLNVPLLFKGDDFARTDIRPALG